MKTIKIQGKEYAIEKGDYILFNGACYQFCAGDDRCLKFGKWHKMTTLLFPKSRLKEISFDTMRKVERGSKEKDTLMIRWYF